MKNKSEWKVSMSVIAMVIGLVLTFTPSASTANNQAPKQNAVGGATLPPLLISEYRLRGPNGATDEFVELENPQHTVNSNGE